MRQKLIALAVFACSITCFLPPLVVLADNQQTPSQPAQPAQPAQNTPSNTSKTGGPTGNDEEMTYMQYIVGKPGQIDTSVMRNYTDAAVMVNLFARYLAIGAGALFFFLILVAGFQIVFSPAKEEALKKAKKNMTTGVIGLIVVMAAYWIAEIIFMLTGYTEVMK